ncbi:MAG: phosphoadenylyl-sulfate reductase [Pseudomonadales bacterium]|nr:phosphoadenylyl-sulfate reductase [Pseudomonadales bacterium]
MTSQSDIDALNSRLQDAAPRDIMQEALQGFERVALSFSGAEDVLLVHFAARMDPKPQIFTLETGRLHPATLRFLDKVRSHYGLQIEMLYPDGKALEKLVSSKGLFSFYEDGHEECCGIRKVEPLRRKLATVDAWITGQRRDQSPSRLDVPLVELDGANAAPGSQLLKFNPLANWTSSQVWETIRLLEIPYNPLHDQGYISIGCEPCTRPVGPGQHEREGRWWWEEATIKECGLHRSNLADPDA